MAPKHRAPLSRAHSRTGSSTKLAAGNLQFTTQKKVQSRAPPKQVHQPQTNGHAQQTSQLKNKTRGSNFRISSPSVDDDASGEDWVSSESGAATPSRYDDEDSESEEEVHTRWRGQTSHQVPTPKVGKPQELPRVATARAGDFDAAGPTPAKPATTVAVEDKALSSPPTPDSARTPTTAPPSPSSRRYSQPSVSKPHSRPLSTHSMYKTELRPHPLIRGQSFGQPGNAAKPSPLQPIAVTLDVNDIHVTASPTVSEGIPRSFSPPASPHLEKGRRSSISSTRSAMTVNSHGVGHRAQDNPSRNRTFSTLSSASLSSLPFGHFHQPSATFSLTHLPTHSRPPPHVIMFPSSDPKMPLEKIHPLLPPPYVANHLAICSQRVPVADAFARTVKARLELVASK